MYITLFIQAEEDISSIYRVEGYNNPPFHRNGRIEVQEEYNSTSFNVQSEFYEFQTDYDRASEEAKRDNKYIFLLVTEEFCQWCEKLIGTVFQDRKIVDILKEKYVSVIVDKNNGFYPSNVGITGVPSVFIIHPKSGRILMDMVGYHEVDFYLQRFKEMDTIEN
jgi:hypothetical protein